MASTTIDKPLLLVTDSSYTRRTLAGQLKTILPQNTPITPYAVDETENPPLSGSYFVIFSGETVYKKFIGLGLSAHIDRYLIGTRTMISDRLDTILSLPREEEILLVTDCRKTAEEAIQNLQDLGFGFLQLRPYYPNCGLPYTHDTLVITPGDPDCVPPGVGKVYNVGPRPFDFDTVLRIMVLFGVLEEKIQDYARTYLEKLIAFAHRISDAAEEAKLMETLRASLLGNGFYARYRFEDIIGRDPAIVKLKDSAAKIAKTDFTVLIEGENGTGKELLASAIHNASPRKNLPFVSINFSALPDQLIESELFGYEGGAFPGARKEGKTGLFQQADGGTVFLNEIGDMSMALQAKLLRVLQEKEILKVGGTRVIPVDVRIIAATNCDLQQMIRDRHFRKDLYFRLKESYLRLPPLSERKDDIPLLIEHWMNTRFKSYKEISTSTMETLMRRDWPGNIRELLNVMKFALTVSEKDIITTDDLPYDGLEPLDISNIWDPSACADEISLTILSAIHEINQRNEIAGRNRIYWFLRDNGISLSEYKIRKKLNELTDNGLISSTHGKYGLSLTDKGIMILENRKVR